MAEAKCSGCRKKDLTQHHCKGYVQREQPKAQLKCTCECGTSCYGNMGTVEERKLENDEIVKRAHENRWQGCPAGYRGGRR
jgi:hypothetical protein